MTVRIDCQLVPSTVVIQSFRPQNIPRWIETCLNSVRTWANAAGFTYKFVEDEIFELLPQSYRKTAEGRIPIQTDLGRLLLIRHALRETHARAIWVDADVLVFNSQHLNLPFDVGHAFSREIWVQRNQTDPGRLRVYRNVNNAFCLFERGDVFLDFYIHACERIIDGSKGNVPNQIVGPKFLTALHNILEFSLIESVGMFSPIVIRDIVQGGGEALERLTTQTEGHLGAANLCFSLVGKVFDGVEMSNDLMDDVCACLKNQDSMGLWPGE